MRVKLTRKQIIELNIVLKSTNFDLPINGKFRYMLTSNLKITAKEIDEINDAFPAVQGYSEYKTKEADIYKSFGITNPADKSTLEEDKKLALEEKLIALKTENDKVIAEQDVVNKEKFAFLNEEYEIDLKTVKPDEVPNISETNKFGHWDIWNSLSVVVVE